VIDRGQPREPPSALRKEPKLTKATKMHQTVLRLFCFLGVQSVSFVPGLCSAPGSGLAPHRELLLMLLSAGLVCTSSAQPFQLPTENRAPLQAGAEEQAFAGTAGKSWESGTFGCVRSGRAQMHEGLDIRCLKRDRRGEPKDEVWATAPGTVVYINTLRSIQLRKVRHHPPRGRWG